MTPVHSEVYVPPGGLSSPLDGGPVLLSGPQPELPPESGADGETPIKAGQTGGLCGTKQLSSGTGPDQLEAASCRGAEWTVTGALHWRPAQDLVPGGGGASDTLPHKIQDGETEAGRFLLTHS